MTDRHQKTAYPLRMSDELRAKLEECARNIGRSLNSEIVARLEASFNQDAYKAGLDEAKEQIRALIVEEIELRLNPSDLLKQRR